MQKFRYKAHVVAINAKGEKGAFNLYKPAAGPIDQDEIDKDLFFGEKFRGRMRNGESSDFVVVKVISIRCVTDPFFIRVIGVGMERVEGFIQLGNYDYPTDPNPIHRKSPLTGLEVTFEMQPNEGLAFNDHHFWSSDYRVRWNKSDYIVTGSGEVWTFPRSDWELNMAAKAEVDYWHAIDLLDSLPELQA